MSADYSTALIMGPPESVDAPESSDNDGKIGPILMSRGCLGRSIEIWLFPLRRIWTFEPGLTGFRGWLKSQTADLEVLSWLPLSSQLFATFTSPNSTP